MRWRVLAAAHRHLRDDLYPGSPSLSGILCVRHTMTNRSMYAKQEEADAAVAGDPPRTH